MFFSWYTSGSEIKGNFLKQNPVFFPSEYGSFIETNTMAYNIMSFYAVVEWQIRSIDHSQIAVIRYN